MIADWLRDGTTAVEVQALLAISLANGGRLEEAQTAASSATAANPKSSLALAAQGYVKSKDDKANEGLRDLSRAIRLSRKFPAGLLVRSVLNRQLVRHDSALQDFRGALALKPQNLMVTRMLAMQLAASPIEGQRDPAKAVLLAQNACERSEFMDWRSLAVLAAGQASLGNFDDAIIAQRAALELSPHRELATGRVRLALYHDNRVFRLK